MQQKSHLMENKRRKKEAEYLLTLSTTWETDRKRVKLKSPRGDPRMLYNQGFFKVI